ncbi:bis(5'-nucleosyl)-tetraphosphatase (symmetrical) YqeK [Cytobacillus purgationiresistens]|uniref:bis(5'-nucleosyl)-tetraphosphatase (symmetrical) n=1 Tax=Cytobacillus purgationiresistens TaxID=863449 RepID=A0ABU0AFH0_9BACI|nr:bis(5'-nucleosyl)-tetraphosphatase (symmetrical) YqeK [Cytobacillus purgationiresistens]MDQ0269527.1 putative HD superfamily hydrolase involved in NAD metabolism [Cytobacillus purgationiresistens]
MNRDQALEIVKEQLTDHRYKHTIGVMETAIWLAERYGADPKKAELAAIFHDYAKFHPKEQMKQRIIEEKMPSDLLEYSSELWHAPVGAYFVEKLIGIQDEDILNAIKYHTSGRVGMTLLEKVVYLADYMEPGRHFPGVDEVRELAESDLHSALVKSVQNSIIFLLKKSQPVYPVTFDMYNDLVMNGKD